MNKRIKKIIIALALCSGLFASVAPKIIGIAIQQAFNADLLNEIAKQTNNRINITLSQINSSWFQTFISLNIEYRAPTANESISAIADLNIDHGLFILEAKQPKFGLASAEIKIKTDDSKKLAKIFNQMKLELPTLTSNVFIGVNQRLEIAIEIPPLSAENKVFKTNSQGLIVEILFEKDRSVNAKLFSRQIDAQDLIRNSEVNVSGLQITVASEDLNRVEAPSGFSLVIPSIAIMGSTQFSARDVSAVLEINDSDANDKSVNISQNISVINIQSGFPITSLSWASEIKEVRHEIFEKYNQILSSIRSQARADPLTAVAEASQIGEEIGLLSIQNKLELNNHITANIYDDENTVDLKFKFKGLPHLTNLDKLDTNELINHLVASLDISLGANAVKNSGFTSLIEQYIELGYIIDNGERLNLNGKIQDSELHLNNTTISLEEFFE